MYVRMYVVGRFTRAEVATSICGLEDGWISFRSGQFGEATMGYCCQESGHKQRFIVLPDTTLTELPRVILHREGGNWRQQLHLTNRMGRIRKRVRFVKVMNKSDYEDPEKRANNVKVLNESDSWEDSEQEQMMWRYWTRVILEKILNKSK